MPTTRPQDKSLEEMSLAKQLIKPVTIHIMDKCQQRCNEEGKFERLAESGIEGN